MAWKVVKALPQPMLLTLQLSLSTCLFLSLLQDLLPSQADSVRGLPALPSKQWDFNSFVPSKLVAVASSPIRKPKPNQTQSSKSKAITEPTSAPPKPRGPRRAAEKGR